MSGEFNERQQSIVDGILSNELFQKKVKNPNKDSVWDKLKNTWNELKADDRSVKEVITDFVNMYREDDDQDVPGSLAEQNGMSIEPLAQEAALNSYDSYTPLSERKAPTGNLEYDNMENGSFVPIDEDHNDESSLILINGALSNMGYLHIKGTAGLRDYSSKTRKAVKEYQKDYDLEPTGVVDETTFRMLTND